MRVGAMKEWSLVPLRLLIGFGFAAHGVAKLSHGPEKFGTILAALGVPFPHTMAWITSLVELIGGVLVMAGAFLLPVSLPLIVVMLTAMFTVHLRYGFSSIKLLSANATGATFGPPGYEVDLLYIVGMITLVLAGPGTFSVDRYRHRSKS